MADDRVFNFNGPTVFNDIHDNKDCTIIVPSPTDNTKKAAGEMKAKPERKSVIMSTKKTAQVSKSRELMTFSKRGPLDENIKLLYSQMVSDGWIAPETKVDDFLDLFSGNRSECTVIWADKYGKSTLVFLFQYFDSEGVIAFPKGFTIPNILMGHFVDREGNFLTNLDKGDDPNDKAGAEILEFLNILKLNASRAGRRPKRIEHTDDELGYGDCINSFELEQEGMHITSKL